MAKIEIAKTELVWPGKYNEDGTLKEVPHVSLPFQVIESVNESRATREAKEVEHPTLFDIYEGKEGDTFDEGWKNKLIWGDNLLVMGSLLEKFAGKIDLIYIDPPFATGADFKFETLVGESDIELTKEQSIIEEKAYRDTWGRGIESYLKMLHERIHLMRDLLSNTGSIYIHCDWRVNSYIRLLLSDVFGDGQFQNEIVWCYRGMAVSTNHYVRRHDTILYYTKSDNWTFNWEDIAEELTDTTKSKYKYQDKDGRHFRLHGRNIKGSPIQNHTDIEIKWLNTNPELVRVDYLDEKVGSKPRDWIQLDYLNVMSDEKVGFLTQKPESLLERILKASSSQGDLVADFFSGSGTTMAVAEKLGRRWIGCDLGRFPIHISRKRLLDIENCKPFEVLNLGKYERQYWQVVTFGVGRDRSLDETALYEYLAFILRLYGAQPVSGLMNLHGKKGKALVHIGAVDSPVTMSEIDDAVNECVQLKQKELHVLGWEWEMGLYDLMVAAAKKKGVKLLLLNIPREVMEQQAADKGDIQFFELAYLELVLQEQKDLKVKVKLKDFVIPNTELIPEDVRSKVKKWSDYIDYWAVDWDFQNDSFMQGWVAYRTRKERDLPLVSGAHQYDKTGTYRVLVKVVDIFGNDTSQAFDAEVK